MKGNTHLAAVSIQGDRIWNAETGTVLHTFGDTDFFRLAVTFALSANGRFLAISAREGWVGVREVQTSRLLVWRARNGIGWIRALAFTPDETILATAGDDHAIRLWDAATGRLLKMLGRPSTPITAIAFGDEGDTLTTISEDRTASLWSLAQPAWIRQEDCSGFLPYDSTRNHEVARHLWKLEASTLPNPDKISEASVIVAASPNGSLLALHDREAAIVIWNLNTGRVQCTLEDSACWWVIATFSPDNRFLGCEDGQRIRIFDVQTGAVVQELPPEARADVLAFAPDSRTLALGRSQFGLSLYYLSTGKLGRVLPVANMEVFALAFSPDGKTLAIGDMATESVLLMTMGRSRNTTPLVGYSGAVCSVAFSPNGTRFAAGMPDGIVKLWNVESRALLATLAPLPSMEWIIYTPDGFYTGSPMAEEHIGWRNSSGLLPAKAFSDRFRQPAILQAVLQ
jgi:WD40 repeat protein